MMPANNPTNSAAAATPITTPVPSEVGNGREGGLFGLKDFMEVKTISGAPA
jgi:hypothetical protein